MEGKRPLENQGVDGKIILRWIFQEVGRGGMDWMDLAQERDGWRELANGSIKCGGIS